MKPLVSTITPCFRMKKYLKTFLEELPHQTYFEQLEVVLDHNEPDEEEIQWVKDFQTKYPGRIKHIIIPKVEPIGTSMNRCIKEASGEFVTIWNVDDLRTANSIEAQVKTLQKENADVVYGDYIIVRSFGPNSKTGKKVLHENIPASEFTRSMIFGPFIMFKKSLCEKAGFFDEQLKSGADFDLSIRLAFNGKAVFTPELLGYYLNEGLGASTRPNSRQPIDRTLIEVRYGIYDKIDYDYIPSLADFDIKNIIQFGNRISVETFVPGYKKLLEERKEKWFEKGLRSYTLQKYLYVKKIKGVLKKIYKNIKP